MNLEEQFTTILETESEKEIIPFLQSCTLKERQTLSPLIKKSAKHYFEIIQKGNSWSSRASKEQQHILQCAQFACYNRKEFDSTGSLWFINRDFLDLFLTWYCPSWFNEFVNSLADRDWLPYALTYDYLMELEQRGFIQPIPQLVARLLVEQIFIMKDREHFCVPERLKDHPSTLDQHIWYLFEYRTNVHNSARYKYYKGTGVAGDWISVFTSFSQEGLISRERLLLESIRASNRNFDKNLSGWFIELFEKLEPDANELMALREEIFNLFSSPNTKVVNSALKSCKAIVDRDEFPACNFLDYSSVLVSSDTKTVVTSTLQLLEKLAKKHTGLSSEIAKTVSSVFILKDENLQTRASKIIDKWGNKEDRELREVLSQSAGLMLSAPKQMLAAYFDNEANQTAAVEFESEKKVLTDHMRLPEVNDVDELVFLASQAFDNNEIWHIDLLPAAIIRLHPEIGPNDIEKFEPAVQRALKFFFGDWRSTQGMLDNLLASFFLDYVLILLQKYPEVSHSLKALYKSYMDKTEGNSKIWEEHVLSTRFFTEMAKESSRIYIPYQKLLEVVLDKLKTNNPVVLLSTPTHAPWWIDPLILVERFKEYQQREEAICRIDFEIAFSRCWLYQPDEALKKADTDLYGEHKNLIQFLLDQKARPIGPFSTEAFWMTAGLAKSPNVVYPEFHEFSYSLHPRPWYTGQYPWSTIVENYTYETHEWLNEKFEKVTKKDKRKVIRIDFLKEEKVENKVGGMQKILSFFKGPNKAQAIPDPKPLIHRYIDISNRYIVTEDRDIKRIYGIFPSNPEPLFALVTDRCLSQSQFTSESEKRMVIAVLQAYYESQVKLEEMGHLFISACLLCSDKTASAYAAEIWVQGDQLSTLDSTLLGTMLGIHEKIEFAPLKRFTDLVVGKMMGVSKSHNKALEKMIASMLEQLPEEPIKGLKKLLEIYVELLQVNNSRAENEILLNKLKAWNARGMLGKGKRDVG